MEVARAEFEELAEETCCELRRGGIEVSLEFCWGLDLGATPEQAVSG